MGESTPVSSGGRTTCSGRASGSGEPQPLYQWARKRLRGCGASGSTSRTSAAMAAGMVAGSASWAKVGMTMPASRNRSTVRR